MNELISYNSAYALTHSLLKKGILLTLIVCSFTGCASEALRDNTVEAGATTTDVMYEMVLSNIAMIRYYKGADVLPWDFKINQGIIAVNDSGGITPGGTFGSAHGIVAPTVMIPVSRASQQQWTVDPTNDMKLLSNLEILYKNEEEKHPEIYRNGIPPMGCLSGAYRDLQVWVDPNKPEDMSALTIFVKKVLGAPLSNENVDNIVKSIQKERATALAAAKTKTANTTIPQNIQPH